MGRYENGYNVYSALQGVSELHAQSKWNSHEEKESKDTKYRYSDVQSKGGLIHGSCPTALIQRVMDQA